MNPENFQKIDKIIHEKGRLGIVSILAATEQVSFTDLKNTLGMTDGNLITHIKALQNAGYVAVAKTRKDNRPLSLCLLTEDGKKAFRDYLQLLETILKENK